MCSFNNYCCHLRTTAKHFTSSGSDSLGPEAGAGQQDRRHTFEHGQLSNLLAELALHVVVVLVLVLEVGGGHPAGLLGQVFPHEPPVAVVTLCGRGTPG